ncbi:MAG: ABC transporter ATP-binding protein [Gemmatimonadetes bacterium]|nr:ABC transporter ATP-binding protein [Gemmatimonadota bacterium]MDE3259416.1 ABC transporter ATP-binding protein [Gemmatimonadota bacterium]
MTLRAERVSKRYGDVSVLRDVSIEVSRSQSLAVVGPSGSGKSTLLHVFGTLDRPTSGRVTVDGRDPYVLPEKDLARFRNRVIGFVFQDHHLLPQYSVLENVMMPTLAFRDGGADAAERARDLVERVGLGHRTNHRPSALSGGERQRVAVARALVNRPALLLCDEPTGSLDRALADEVGDLLFELHAEQETILIGVTHSLELAARFERRMALQEGTCVEA